MSQTEVQLIKDAVIVNADVSGSAAIDVSKISGALPAAGGTITGDVTFDGETAGRDIVFDRSDNSFEFADNAEARFGAGNDLQIYHNGTDSKITNTTGNFIIDHSNGIIRLDPKTNENGILIRPDGAVELYYDNSKKVETTSGGFKVFNKLELPDGGATGTSARITVGTSDDLKIYHDGSNSFIKNSTGELDLNSDTIHLRNGANSENYARFLANGAVELYHNNNKKLDTTSAGIDVTGRVTADDLTVENTSGNLSAFFTATNGLGTLEIGGSTGAFIDLKTPASDDFDLRVNADGTLTSGGNIQLVVQGNENGLRVLANGACELYHDAGLRLSTTSNGVSVSGRQIIQSYNDAVNSLLQTTNSGGAYIQHATGASGATIAYTGHSSQLCLSPTVGNYAIRFEGDALEFSKSNSIQARITSHGGIAFGSDTAAVNTLDDYEEGGWTPAIGSGSGSLSVHKATYTKIGRSVFIQFYFSINSTSGNGANAIFTGLPFAVQSNGWTAAQLNTGFSSDGIHCRAQAGSSQIDIKTTADTAITFAQLNGTWILSGIHYFTDS